MAEDTMANNTVAHNTVAHNTQFPQDIWQYYTDAMTMAADGAAYRNLRNLRGASHFTLDLVDRLLGPGDMLTRLQARGTQYCQGPLNHDIQIDHRALASAMEDFLEDEASQLTILQSLDMFLTHQNATVFYSVPNPNQQPQTALIGIYRAVAQSLRRHHENLAVLHMACRVLGQLPHLSGMSTFTALLKTYIIETLAFVVDHHPLQVHSMLYCVETLYTIHAPNDRSIMMGSHNLFTILLRGIFNSQNQEDIFSIVYHMQEACATITASVHDDAQMAMVDMPALQTTLLRLAEENTAVPVAIVAARCLSVVATLASLYPERIFTPTRIVAAAKKALIANMNDLLMLRTVIRVFSSILRIKWDPDIGVPGTATARTTLEANDIMLLTYTAMRSQFVDVHGAEVCAGLFKLLRQLCQNHAGHSAHAREYSMLRVLSTRFRQAAGGYQHWLDMQTQFENVLQTNVAQIADTPA